MEGGNYVNRSNTRHHRDDNTNNNSFISFEDHQYSPWGTSSSSWPARNYCCSFCKREFRSAQALGGHMNVHRRDRARLRSSSLLLSSSSSSLSLVSSNSNHQCPKPNPNPSNTIIINSICPNNNNNNPSTLLFTSPSSSSSSPSPLLLSNEILNFSSQSSHLSPMYNSSPCCLTLSNYSPSSPSSPRLASSPIMLPLLSPHQSMETNTRSDFVGIGDEEEEKLKEVLKNNELNNNITLELGIGLLEHQEEKLDLELRLGHHS